MLQNKEERENFWRLCGEYDRKLLQKKIPMTIGDLDRLAYLSAYPGFEEDSLEIWGEFTPQFKEEFLCLQAFQMDRLAWLRKGDTESEKKLHALWLKEFRKNSRQNPPIL